MRPIKEISNTFFINFSSWKKPFRDYLNIEKSYFIRKNVTWLEFNFFYKYFILSKKDKAFISWGKDIPDFINHFIKSHDIPLYFMEDGFLRSIKLGATKAKPCSVIIDGQAPYFDATQRTDLEDILNDYDFGGNPSLVTRATHAVKLIKKAQLSKYNHASFCDIQELYGIKTRKRILVIGQVEEDASIRYGCDRMMTNQDLIEIACRENPKAHIIYKPHPDVWHGLRDAKSNVNIFQDKVQILSADIPISQALETIDHVYTITSLVGFEAVLRDIKVTTIGAPFYAGWGITDTRQATPRRKRILTSIEIFAAAYILYPIYFNHNKNKLCEIEDIIEILSTSKIS